MPAREAVATLHAARRNGEVVVTSMGSARDWMALGTQPLDLVYVPSSMGQATSVGLGLALAQPQRRVIVCNGDGSMLMNLGSLVSITAAAPRNLTLILFDNGAYEVTGGQPTPGAPLGRRSASRVDFAELARGCGFSSVFHFDDAGAWQRDVRTVLDAEGPAIAILSVAPIPGVPGPRSPGPGAERARQFMRALRGDGRD